jgi:hypothetical protein
MSTFSKPFPPSSTDSKLPPKKKQKKDKKSKSSNQISHATEKETTPVNSLEL